MIEKIKLNELRSVWNNAEGPMMIVYKLNEIIEWCNNHTVEKEVEKIHEDYEEEKREQRANFFKYRGGKY